MNEFEPNKRVDLLTRRKPYSTLNIAHSLNVRFIMDSAPKENKPQLPPTERRADPVLPVPSVEQEIAREMTRRLAADTGQPEAEVEKVLNDLRKQALEGREHPHERLMREKAENDYSLMYPRVPEHPDDVVLREKLIKTPKAGQAHPDLMDMNIIGGTEYGSSITGITDPTIIAKLEEVQQKLNVELSETDAIRNLSKLTGEILEMRGRVGEPDINAAISKLQGFMRTYERKHSVDQEDKKFRGFSLQWRDMQDIDKGAEAWLDGQFDILYDLAEKGGELLDSPQVRAIEAKFNEAVGYLLLEGRSIDEVVAVQTKYNIQTSLFFMSASVSRRNLEGIQGSAVRLKTEGLFTALSFNGGRVGSMLTRMADMVNVTRISEGGYVEEGHGDHKVITSERQHLDNKMINDIKKRLVAEQYDLAIYAEAGSYAGRYEEIREEMSTKPLKAGETRLAPDEVVRLAREQLRKEIRGNINVAHDAYLVLQMQAVEASRGKRIEGMPYRFFTDPKGIFDFLNIEEFLTNKWGSLQHEQMLFLRQIKLDIARNESDKKDIKNLDLRQLEELGTRLFKELFTVPDFFSSSWRIRGIRDHIERLQRYHLENKHLQTHISDVGDVSEGRGGSEKGLKVLEDLPGDTPKIKKDNVALESLRTKIIAVREKVRDWKTAEKASAIRAGEASIDADGSLSNEEKISKKGELRNSILNRKVYTPEEKQKEFIDFLSRNASDRRGGLTLEERNIYLSTMVTKDDRKNIKTQAEENAGEFALFLALKAASGDTPEKKRANQKIAWEKIQKYKPEEMIRFVRERKGAIGDWEELRAIDKIFTENGIMGDTKIDYSGNEIQIRAADVFRRDYLPALSMIREEAFRGVPPEQIDFRNINDAKYAKYREKINKALNGVWTPPAGNPDMLPTEMIVKLMGSMDTYISREHITDQLLDNSEYEDLGARVQKSDDLLLDQLEVVPENMPAGNVSSFWTSEAAGDALVRNYNDIGNAQKAGGALVGFLTTEGTAEYQKKAIEFGTYVKEYNGTEGMAKAVRYTLGSYLKVAKQDYVVDLLGLGKLGRMDVADIQRIFGQGVSTETCESLLKITDHIRGYLTSDNHDDPEKYYKNLIEELGITGFDRLRDKTLTGSIYLLILLLIGSSLAAGVAGFKEATK